MKLILTTLAVLFCFCAKAQITPPQDTSMILLKSVPNTMRTDTLADNLLTYNNATNTAQRMSGITLKGYFQKGLTTSARTIADSIRLVNEINRALGVESSKANTSAIPTNLNQLTNGPGYITSLSLSAGNGISVTGSGTSGSPYIVSLINPTINYTPARTIVTTTGATGYTINTTKPSYAFYTITCSVTNPLLIGTSTATCYFEYYNGTAWVPVTSISNSSSVGVTVAIQLTNGQTGVIGGLVLPNVSTRIRSLLSGTATVTYVSGIEWYY